MVSPVPRVSAGHTNVISPLETITTWQPWCPGLVTLAASSIISRPIPLTLGVTEPE